MQAFNITIKNGISAQRHDREVIYGINTTDKRFIFHLMATVHIPLRQRFDTQMEMNTSTHNADASLAL